MYVYIHTILSFSLPLTLIVLPYLTPHISLTGCIVRVS